MQRIKLNVFKSWFDKNLTGKEIDFLLVLSFYQDKRGVTRGVYYKDMMREGKMSAQTFYDCKKSLTEKGVISSVEGQDDYDITLIGNDFTIYGKEDYEEGKVKYLSTTYHLFRDPYFRTLKPKQKLLVMDLLNIQMAGRPNGVNAYRIYRKNFIKKYANIKQNDGTKSKGLLDITVRTLQKYFKLLKYYFSVSLKNGMYFFTLKSKFAKSGVNHTTENHITIQHLVKAACRRNKIKDPDAKEQEKIEKVLEITSNNHIIMIDKLCKRILEHPETLGRIIKGFIKEAKDVSLEEIIELIKEKKDWEGNSYFQQLNNVIDIAHHGRVEFDYLCCINLPQDDGTMKRIYLDVEIQNVENPGYAPLTRGNDYLSRMITSQNGKEYDYRNYDGMKKTYVIWILPQAAKKRDGHVNCINSKLENISGSTIERLESYDKSEQIMISKRSMRVVIGSRHR